MDWHPGKPAESASLVEVQFTALGSERTRIELTQSNWEAVAEDKAGKFRASYGGNVGTSRIPTFPPQLRPLYLPRQRSPELRNNAVRL